MGKNHNKDRMYITATEWREEWGGNKNRPATTHRFKKLPFNCCSLSLRPFDDPVCTLDGHVFDIANIIPYIKKQKKNPVTGFKLSAKELTPLHYHKNTDDQFVCPVLHKVFTEHSVIVAIRTSGHVYSKEAIVKLNLNTKDLHDLITGQAFERSDVITLQVAPTRRLAAPPRRPAYWPAPRAPRPQPRAPCYVPVPVSVAWHSSRGQSLRAGCATVGNRTRTAASSPSTSSTT